MVGPDAEVLDPNTLKLYTNKANYQIVTSHSSCSDFSYTFHNDQKALLNKEDK